MKQKLNVLLAITDHLASVYKKGLEEYVKFFKGSQGAFKGEKKTYIPKPGTIDIPGNRGNILVATTVTEKLDYLSQSSSDYIDSLFALEKTNSAGLASAELLVDGKSFGKLSSLELLRLKSLLEHGTFKDVYENIPVRSDSENWTSTNDDMYTSRNIYEGPKTAGVQKSTIKESYILPDPNISSTSVTNYIPQLASKDTVIELGDYTFQKFSGELSHLERAGILQRRSKLLTAVINALKVANDVESISSDMTARKLFSYLHEGVLA